MKTNWKILGLIVGLLIVSLAMPAMAESGSFDSVGGLISQSYVLDNPGGDYANISGLYIRNIQNQTGLNSLFMVTYPASGWATSDTGSTSVNLYAGDTIIGTGTFGYSYSAVTTMHTVYLYVNSINVGTLSGTKYINFTPLATVRTWTLNGFKVLYNVGAGTTINAVYFAGEGATNNPHTYMKYQSAEFHNTWSTSYVTPISTISVTKTIGSQSYPSEIYIMQGTTVLASNTTLTTDPYTTTITGAPYFTINASDMWGNWYVSPLIYGSGTAPVYNISVLPATITTTTSSLGGITSTIDTLLTGITDITWYWSDAGSTDRQSFYETGNTSRPLDYALRSGTWYGWDATVHNYVNTKTTLPNPVTLSGITSTGDKTIWCYIGTSDGNYYTLTATLTVGGAGAEESGRLLVEAADWRTDDLVQGAAINIENIASGIWSNQTTDIGSREFFAPVGTRLYVEAYKSGYDRNANSMYQIRGLHDFITITLFPTGSGSSTITNTTLYVTTYDYDTRSKLPGTSVRVVDDGQFKVTPASGTVSFTVINGSAYTVSCGCSAGQCYSGTKTETVSGASYVMQFFLLSVKAPTATPTPGPGQTAAPKPTPTLDTRTSNEKAIAMTKILYDNGENIVTFFMILIFVGGVGLVYKQWK